MPRDFTGCEINQYEKYILYFPYWSKYELYKKFIYL